MIVYEPPRAATRIALVDLAGSFDDAAKQARVAREIHAALRETGFFYVTGHGVPDALCKAQLDAATTFFDQPETAKAALSIAHSTCRRGYEGHGRQILDEGSAPDLKESFMLARELAPDHPWVSAGVPMQGANQWPELPGFRAQMEAWQDEMTRLGRHLMACLALSVDLDADWFTEGLGEPQCGVRLLRYPPQPPSRETNNQLGAGAHSDWGSITILLQDDMAGLEVRNTDGDWICADPLAGSFVINIGQMMERFTGGLYRANLHRVRNNHASRARHSVATFFELEPLYSMKTAPTCAHLDEVTTPMTIGEHLEDMARRSYAA